MDIQVEEPFRHGGVQLRHLHEVVQEKADCGRLGLTEPLIPLLLRRISLEEKAMHLRFGDEFTKYARKTKKLVPLIYRSQPLKATQSKTELNVCPSRRFLSWVQPSRD
jgi:hypothetical protein